MKVTVPAHVLVGSCYGSLALFTSILHNVFLIYHVETFVSVYKIDKTWFWIGEAIFLLWNSCNDPLFGWISDRSMLNSQSVGDSKDTLQILVRRLTALSWNGPLFGLSFLLLWFSWGIPQLQFVVCLCLYDGFLTMVDLHYNALLADMVISSEDRTRLNSYSSLFGAVGSLSVFLSYTIWSRENMASFQLMCIILTAFSVCGFVVCTRVLRKHFSKKLLSEESAMNVQISENGAKKIPLGECRSPALAFVKQLTKHKNFCWFSCMNLIQVFHCHFNSNFFPLFLENLLTGTVRPGLASLLLGVSFVAPHINNLYFLTLCRKYGVYSVIRWLFAIKLGLSLFMLTMGPEHTWLLCIFIASNRIFTEGTCKLLNLVISDLVDEDFVLHQRQQPISALIFGTAALLSKPGQTLAPLLGTGLLAAYTGRDIFQSGNALSSIKRHSTIVPSNQAYSHRYGVFAILVYVPIACAILQLMVWSRFTLRGRRLNWVKAIRAGARQATV